MSQIGYIRLVHAPLVARLVQTRRLNVKTVVEHGHPLELPQGRQNVLLLVQPVTSRRSSVRMLVGHGRAVVLP